MAFLFAALRFSLFVNAKSTLTMSTCRSYPSSSAKLTLSLVLVAFLTIGVAPSTRSLADLDSIIQNGSAASAFWGIDVRDVETGEVLFSHNNSHRFLPASNQKLLTSATALDALGSDYRYETGLYFDGEVEGDVLKGDLIIKGSGDPTLGSSEMRVSNPLRSWARQLAAMGVSRVEGRIIGDDSVFDGQPYAEGWDVDYVMTQSSRLLGVSIGGLSYRDNLVRVQVRSNNSGVEVVTYPADVMEIRNNVSVSPRRRGRAINVERGVGLESVYLTGSVPTNYRGTLLIPILNPTTFTLRSLRGYLDDAGIDVSALTTHDIDELDEGPSDDYEDYPLFVYYSPPLSEILNLLNKESNNFYADQVFRTFGYRGTADGAENRINALMQRAGVDPSSISIRDGSGLSRKNLVTPAALSQLLVYMHNHSSSDAFKTTLARGGEPETTLRRRLGNVDVQAKTGSLEFARALSGYTTLPDGREVAFTLIANNYEGPSYRVTQLLDRLVVSMAS